MKIKHILTVGSLWKILFCLGICAFAIPIFAQTDVPGDFKELVAATHGQLIERLKLFVEYDRTKQFDKKYDLLSRSLRNSETKAQYTAKSHYLSDTGKRKSFTSFDINQEAVVPQDKFVYFELILKSGSDKTPKEETRLLYATYEKDNWYFSDWDFILFIPFIVSDFDALKERIDKFYRALDNQPAARGVFITYGSKKEILKCEAEIKKVIKLRNYDIKRIKLDRAIRKSEIKTQMFLIQKGEKDPVPEP